MKDLQKIKEFFSKPVNEESPNTETLTLELIKAYRIDKEKALKIMNSPIGNQIKKIIDLGHAKTAPEALGIIQGGGARTFNYLGSLEEAKTAVDMAKKQLDALGVKYELGNKFKPFKVIYKPTDQSDEFYDTFEDIVDLFNLKGVVKSSMNEASMLDNYEVDFFHTKANVYANIEIPSENPTFEDDIQIKGTGKTEEEAFEDLKRNYEKYKKTGISEAKEESLYKDWDQFEKPSKIKVYLNSGKTLEISPLKLKGGKRVYDAILQAFIDDRFDITNKVIQGMTNNLSEAKEEDIIDTITMDIPLFLRMLEYSREDASQDMDLHDVTEKAISLGKERGILQMDDYDEIIGSAEEIKEVNLKQAKLSSAEYQKAKKLKDFKASDWKWNASEDLYTKVNEAELTEAYVPSNIREFAKSRGVSSLVNKVAGWAEKVGKSITGGTAIGYGYNTLVLDMGYQSGEIRINIPDETIELYDEPVNSFNDFQRVYADGADSNLEEGKEESLSFISKQRAKADLKQFLSGKRADGMGKYDAIVYGIDSDGKKHQIKYYNDLQNYEKFALGNNPDIKENVAPNHNGKSSPYGSGYKPLEERIAKALNQINEELCPAGKAYIKRRQAAGEKSSAYLSGRAVKVCKGQMSGRAKKK